MLVVGLGSLVISFSTEIKLETMALAVIGIMINLLFKLLDFITISKK